jgi:hypothetical protein
MVAQQDKILRLKDKINRRNIQIKDLKNALKPKEPK